MFTGGIAVRMFSVSHMCEGSDTCSSADDAVLESCDRLKRRSFAGGSELLDAGYEVSYSGHTSCVVTAS